LPSFSAAGICFTAHIIAIQEDKFNALCRGWGGRMGRGNYHEKKPGKHENGQHNSHQLPIG